MIQFEKTIWEIKSITNKNQSAWRCYSCGRGSFVLLEKIPKRNYAAVNINCSACNTAHLILGKVIGFAHNYEVVLEYCAIEDLGIKPTQIRPSISLFKIPDYIDEKIKNKLMFSFDHFWYDMDACANKIRQALELIADELGGTGNILHDKIISLRSKIGPETTDALLALKWIGNDGSHASIDFKRLDILNAYEILVHTLNILYPDNSEKEELSKRISVIKQNKGIKSI
jgi:hypothetical protein